MDNPEIGQIEQAIVALEAQRSQLGDGVLNAALGPLLARLELLRGAPDGVQRKQVTVLFADLAGFTAMAEALDVEEVSDTINALWQQVDRIILGRGGRIDKHIGDAVMALWGAHQGREDDAAQALRAALDIQAALAGAELHVRVGVHTGPVLLGSVGLTKEYTALGDTVNIAQRLQSAAEPGEVMLSQAVYEQTRSQFEFSELVSMVVKGKSEPLSVCRVLEASPQLRPLTQISVGAEEPMVGRAAELRTLQDALQRAMSERQLYMVTVLGEAGLGKSRLLREFWRWLNATELAPLTTLAARARLDTRNQAYGLLRDVFVSHLRLHESDKPERVLQLLEANLRRAFAPHDSAAQAECARRAASLAGLLGFALPDAGGADFAPRVLRDQAQADLVAYLRALALRQPVLILLEDLHWADSSSLDVLEMLLADLADLPICLVGLARPGVLEDRPGWAGVLSGPASQAKRNQVIQLGALDASLALELASSMLKDLPVLPPAIQEMVLQRAEGNPFYIEELMKMLLDQRVIVTSASGKRLVQAERLAGFHLPITLTGLLQARLDSLPAEERRMLQHAAVVGRVFWDQALEYIGSADDPAGAPTPVVAERLAALRQRQFIFSQPDSAFSPAQEFSFKHALLRDVSYESVLKRQRPHYHALVADWMLRQGGERSAEWQGLVGEHLDLAGRPEQAVDFLRKAGHQAARRFANQEALRYYNRVLELTAPDELLARYEILLARVQIYERSNASAERLADLEALSAIADQLDDNQRRAETLLRRCYDADMREDYTGLENAARQAIALAQTAQDALKEAAGYYFLGRAKWRLQDYIAARQWLSLARDRAAALPDPTAPPSAQIAADSVRTLGVVDFIEGKYAQAQAAFGEALPLHRVANDRRGECFTLMNLSHCASNQGELEQAYYLLEAALAICESAGDFYARMTTLLALANMLEEEALGDLSRSRDAFAQLERMSRAQSTPLFTAMALSGLGSTSLYLGDLAAARTALHEAARVNIALGRQRNLGWEYLYLSILHAVLHEWEQASQFGQSATEIAILAEDRLLAGRAACVAGYVAHTNGLPESARTLFEQAMSLCSESDFPPGAFEAQIGLLTSGAPGGDLPAVLAYLERAPDFVRRANLPASAYHSLYTWLAAQGDPRSASLLDTAQRHVRAFVEQLPDAAARARYMALPPVAELFQVG